MVLDSILWNCEPGSNACQDGLVSYPIAGESPLSIDSIDGEIQ